MFSEAAKGLAFIFGKALTKTKDEHIIKVYKKKEEKNMCLQFNKQNLCQNCPHYVKKTIFNHGGVDYYSGESYESSILDIKVCEEYAGKDKNDLEQSQWVCPKYQKAKEKVLKELQSHKWQGTMLIGTRDEIHIVDLLEYKSKWWDNGFTLGLTVETPDHIQKHAWLVLTKKLSENSGVTAWLRDMNLQLDEMTQIAPLRVGETFTGLCVNKYESWIYLAALYGNCHNSEEAKKFDFRPYQKLFPDTKPIVDYKDE